MILGGDIVDAMGMHGVENRRAEDFDKSWYVRDVGLLNTFLKEIRKNAPKAEIIYLEGNHEERYRRVMNKFPQLFKDSFHLLKDSLPKGEEVKWIPYGTYESFYQLGDTIFTHGTIFPDNHSKQYASNHAPFKVIYGHLHDFQAWTIRTAFGGGKFALTAGCLTHNKPDYKKGSPNKWINGFVDFVFDGKVCTPAPHVIENGRFMVGGKVYQ